MPHAENIRHYPLLILWGFGQNPFGQPLYRIVFSDSRKAIVVGLRDLQPRYPEIRSQWILERWIPVEEYAGCDQEYWDQNYAISGPYPARGEYERAFTFDNCTVEDANLPKLISWIEQHRLRRFPQQYAANKEHYDAEQAALSSTYTDLLMDQCRAFLNNAFVGYGGGRGSKTKELKLDAHATGLPVANTFSARG